MSEKDKKAFVLRINPELLKEVEKWAGDEFRSTNGQIEFLLNEAVKAKKRKRLNKNDTDQ
ncbi:Arc family DNA binding domain-containing protein [Pedobacter heparinus]|uniref:Arc family DNA binding domain-containing protein n=1 Tax=Pedobacter heparinus TaxID=984 RepID=UPI00293145C2|nr:Arc family DNA binding domain-containing protein [Pedobacter heparinus]